jgi:hypothetical protein
VLAVTALQQVGNLAAIFEQGTVRTQQRQARQEDHSIS